MPKKFKPQKSSVKNDGKKTAINIFLYGILPILIIFLIIFLVLLIYFPIFLKPNHKIIQYQEEVKLSDGSMIWVDIKRHYRLTGGAPGDAGMFEGAYLPSIVEISWDTGFPSVGRQTLEFDGAHAFEFIDKVNGVWYVEGGKTRCNVDGIVGGVYDENGTCWEGAGTRLNHSAYLYVLGNDSFLKNRSLDELSDFTSYNILDVRQLNDISSPPTEFNGKQISWQQKLDYQNTRRGYGNIFGKPVKQFP